MINRNKDHNYYFSDGQNLYAASVKDPKMDSDCISLYDPEFEIWWEWAVVDPAKLKLLTHEEYILEML